MRLLGLATLLTLAAGCFEPSLRDGVVTCGAGDECPPDFQCNAADQLCYRTPPGTAIDGGPNDGPAADAGDDADTPPDDAGRADAPRPAADSGPLPACSDGLDNDGDGAKDYHLPNSTCGPGDLQCDGPDDNKENI